MATAVLIAVASAAGLVLLVLDARRERRKSKAESGWEKAGREWRAAWESFREADARHVEEAVRRLAAAEQIMDLELRLERERL